LLFLVVVVLFLFLLLSLFISYRHRLSLSCRLCVCCTFFLCGRDFCTLRVSASWGFCCPPFCCIFAYDKSRK
jgi:hypothetical protein